MAQYGDYSLQFILYFIFAYFIYLYLFYSCDFSCGAGVLTQGLLLAR
jgi:hypothetical protein